MSFTKQYPLINTLFGHGSFSPALGDVGASTRGSQMQSMSLSLQLFMNCLFLDLSTSSLTIKISLACSLSELTVQTTCCFTPRSKGYISSFLLELSLKHWCCEPPLPSSCSSNSPSMLSSIDDVSSKKLSFTYCWVFFCVHMALSQHFHTVFLSIFHSL